MAKNKKSIQISEEAWKAYTDKLYNVSATAGKKMEEYILKHGLEDRNALIDYAYGLVTKYSEGTSALAAQMYDEIAAAENALTLSAEVIATPSYGEVAKTVHGTLKKSKNEKSLGGAIQYLVKRTGADTTLHNALRDHAQFAWIPGTGETCSFCRMLASNGWRYMSKKALKNGHAEHIHANCRCTYAIRFSEQSNINGYDPDKYYQEYVDAGRDVNEMRRLQYQNNKELAEKIKAQKREAYAKRKENDLNNKLAKAGLKYVNPDELLYRNAQKIVPEKGFDDVICHADENKFYIDMKGKGNPSDYIEIQANDLAKHIKNSPEYKNNDIRLISCKAGAKEDGPAQQLANAIGKNVKAPTETITVADNGECFISDNDILAEMWYNNGKINNNIKPTGQWKTFYPK